MGRTPEAGRHAAEAAEAAGAGRPAWASRRLLRGLALSVALTALGYIAFSLWGGWHEVMASVRTVGPWGVALMLALSLVNYGLRFVRWQGYLGLLGHRVAWRPSLLIYLSGFALTTTPGKAGEMMRSVFLKPLGVGYGPSTAAFFSERLSDLLAVLVLAGLGLSLYPQFWALIAGGAALCLACLLLLQRAAAAPLPEAGAPPAAGWRKAWASLRTLAHAARRCHGPRALLVAGTLSLLAWAAEGLAFHYMLHALGFAADLRFSFFVYALAMLAGALSFMPGGLGGAEATMVGLLLLAGQAQPAAVAATVLIRLTTLWFAVVLGGGAMALLLRSNDAAAKNMVGVAP